MPVFHTDRTIGQFDGIEARAEFDQDRGRARHDEVRRLGILIDRATIRRTVGGRRGQDHLDTAAGPRR